MFIRDRFYSVCIHLACVYASRMRCTHVSHVVHAFDTRAVFVCLFNPLAHAKLVQCAYVVHFARLICKFAFGYVCHTEHPWGVWAGHEYITLRNSQFKQHILPDDSLSNWKGRISATYFYGVWLEKASTLQNETLLSRKTVQVRNPRVKLARLS